MHRITIHNSLFTDSLSRWAGRAQPTVSRLGPDFRAYVISHYVHRTLKWKRFGEYEYERIL